jgi:hypothetical protein
VTDTPQERSEAARVRRRWLNLGELLAIVAVVISALTLWNSYRERTNTEAEHKAAAEKGSRTTATMIFRATPDRNGTILSLAPRSDSQTVQSQTITFPSALGVSPVDTTGDARIERGWFDSELAKARKAAGAKHDQPGDARLPLLITTHFLVDGEPKVDRGLFELGYEASHAFLSGTTIRLKGLSRVGSVGDDVSGKKQLEALAKGALG